MSETYEKWAYEILQLVDNQCQLTEYTEETVMKLAKKLKNDVANWLVPEEFCADCDYQRRYNQ